MPTTLLKSPASALTGAHVAVPDPCIGPTTAAFVDASVRSSWPSQAAAFDTGDLLLDRSYFAHTGAEPALDLVAGASATPGAFDASPAGFELTSRALTINGTGVEEDDLPERLQLGGTVKALAIALTFTVPTGATLSRLVFQSSVGATNLVGGPLWARYGEAGAGTLEIYSYNLLAASAACAVNTPHTLIVTLRPWVSGGMPIVARLDGAVVGKTLGDPTHPEKVVTDAWRVGTASPSHLIVHRLHIACDTADAGLDVAQWVEDEENQCATVHGVTMA